MAAARFVVVSDDDVNAFSKQQKNENTKKKTLYDLKIFREFLETCNEKREIEKITPAEISLQLQITPTKISLFFTRPHPEVNTVVQP